MLHGLSINPLEAEDRVLDVCLGVLPQHMQKEAVPPVLECLTMIHAGQVASMQDPKDPPPAVPLALYVVRQDGRRWLLAVVHQPCEHGGHLHILHGPDTLAEAAVLEYVQQQEGVN